MADPSSPERPPSIALSSVEKRRIERLKETYARFQPKKKTWDALFSAKQWGSFDQRFQGKGMYQELRSPAAELARRMSLVHKKLNRLEENLREYIDPSNTSVLGAARHTVIKRIKEYRDLCEEKYAQMLVFVDAASKDADSAWPHRINMLREVLDTLKSPTSKKS